VGRHPAVQEPILWTPGCGHDFVLLLVVVSGEMKTRRARYAYFVLPLLAATLLLIGLFSSRTLPRSPLLYKGKPIESWFYGARTNFFYKSTQDEAKEALDAVGTEAFPFLLSNLNGDHGQWTRYFQMYRALPKRVQNYLPYPILSDDIKSITWGHIRHMPKLPTEQVEALAGCVPKLTNPRLRAAGFEAIRFHYETEPAFQRLCRALLGDPHPGIRLKAAIALAASAIVSDPHDPRLFPILLEALESKEARKLSLDINDYTYCQLPPGGSGRSMSTFPGQPDEDVYLRDTILDALHRLKRHLTKPQQARLAEAISPLSNSTAHASGFIYTDGEPKFKTGTAVP
jgi:hypothetical protein